MSQNGVRKRLKVRWMREADGGLDGHAFKLVDAHGHLSDNALCGLPLRSMHLWARQDSGPRCRVCQQAMGKGSRA